MDPRALTADSACPPQKDGVLRIYSMRFCPFAHRARLVAAHKNLDYEEVNINLKSKPAWFLEKNPRGTVPTVDVNGMIVYESSAASDFLDDLYPENNRLTPSDSYRKAQDRMLFEFSNKLNESQAAVAQAKGDDVAVKADEHLKVRKHFEDVLATRGGPFFGGTKPAMIDFLLWPTFERLPAFVQLVNQESVALDKTKEPKLAAWVAAMYDLPAVKKLLHDTPTHLTFLKTLFTSTPAYDLGL